MRTSAIMAAVLLRVTAVFLVGSSAILLLVLLVTGAASGAFRSFAHLGALLLMPLLYGVPGLLLFKYSRPLGGWITRGLD